jgi:hypothetical protein
MTSSLADEKFIDIDTLIKEEIWRIIPGYSKYEISSFGKVRHKEYKNIREPYIHNQYLKVSLSNDDCKQVPCRLHRLLALAFLPNPENYPVIDHINGNKLDNSLSNLRWCSYSTNSKNWCANRTNFKKVIQYSEGKEIIWNSANDAATELKINAGSIRRCCNPDNNETTTYKGFVWKYADPAHQIPRENIDYSDYTPIGKIGELDFPDFWIKNDGSKIVNKKANKEIAYTAADGYKRYTLVSKTKINKQLFLHKIINQIFLGGDYDDVVGHLDGDNLNNDFANLKITSQQEAGAKATGVRVNQINKDTNQVIRTFNSISDAVRSLGKTDRKGIRKVCDRKQNTAYGFKWEKVE